jgi:hypothetical protein
MWEHLGIHKFKINLTNTWEDMGTIGICAKAHGNTWMTNYECFRNTKRKKITGNIGGWGKEQTPKPPKKLNFNCPHPTKEKTSASSTN